MTRDENGDLASGHLVFADQGQLVAVAFDAKKQEVRGRVALVDGIAIASGTAAAQFAVSDSGTLVYLDYLASLSRRLVWVDRDGNTSSAQAGSRAYSDIRFSPDGRRVAVHDHGAGNDIWIYSPERGTATRMSYSPLGDEVPVWSPDGRFVVYTTVNGMGRVLKRAPSDGSGSEEALWETDRHTHVADWTPDGKALVLNLVRPGTRLDTLLLSLEGEPSLQPLLESPFDERNPRLAPGGKWIAYESDASGRRTKSLPVVYPEGARVAFFRSSRVRNMSSPRAEGLKSYGLADEDASSDPTTSTSQQHASHGVDVNGRERVRISFPRHRSRGLFSDPFDRSGARQPHVLLESQVAHDGRFLFVERERGALDDAYGGLYRFQVVINWVAELEERVPSF